MNHTPEPWFNDLASTTELCAVFDKYLQEKFGGPDTDAWHDYDCGKIFADGYALGMAAVTAQRDEMQRRYEQIKKEYFDSQDLKNEKLWSDGFPENSYVDWFIAVLDTGERVVLKALPEEFSYDFTTADHTYYKNFRISKWMQFQDSNFLPFKSAKCEVQP